MTTVERVFFTFSNRFMGLFFVNALVLFTIFCGAENLVGGEISAGSCQTFTAIFFAFLSYMIVLETGDDEAYDAGEDYDTLQRRYAQTARIVIAISACGPMFLVALRYYDFTEMMGTNIFWYIYIACLSLLVLGQWRIAYKLPWRSGYWYE